LALAAEAGSARAGDLSGWKAMAEGGAVVEIAPDTSTPLDGPNTNSWRLTVKDPGQRAGIVSGETAEMNLLVGQWYDLSFYASTEAPKNQHFALTVSLESADGKVVGARATLPEVGGPWTKYHLALHARQSASKWRMVITLAETGTIRLNGMTLVPRKNL
jgi:hypothetical protein